MYFVEFPQIPTEPVDNFVDYRLKTAMKPIEPGLGAYRTTCHRFVIAHIFQWLMNHFSKNNAGLTDRYPLVSTISSLCITAKYGFISFCCKAP